MLIKKELTSRGADLNLHWKGEGSMVEEKLLLFFGSVRVSLPNHGPICLPDTM